MSDVSRRLFLAGAFSGLASRALAQEAADMPAFTYFPMTDMPPSQPLKDGGLAEKGDRVLPGGKPPALDTSELEKADAEAEASQTPVVVQPTAEPPAPRESVPVPTTRPDLPLAEKTVPIPQRRPADLLKAPERAPASRREPVPTRKEPVIARHREPQGEPPKAEEKPSFSLFNILRGASAPRVLALHNSNTGERMRLDIANYRSQKDEFNHFARDWRQNREIDISNRLIEKFGRVAGAAGVSSFNLFCAYRTPETNRMLQRTRGGQANNSRHLFGEAFDIVADGISPASLQTAAARVAQQDGFGGVGYYPRSAMPFVHIDIGGLRRW